MVKELIRNGKRIVITGGSTLGHFIGEKDNRYEKR